MMTTITAEQRQKAITYLCETTGLRREVVDALDVPEGTLRDYANGVNASVADTNKYVGLSLKFLAAAIGIGMAGAIQPLAKQIFSSTSYPDWMHAVMVVAAVVSGGAGLVCWLNSLLSVDKRRARSKVLADGLQGQMEQIVIERGHRSSQPSSVTPNP